MQKPHSKISRHTIGHSAENREISIVANHPPHIRPALLLLGGTHGDEPATISFLQKFTTTHLATLPIPVSILAELNPDGSLRHTRYNANGTDLNRNTSERWSPASIEPPGPTPWSEPESRLLRDWLLAHEPRGIVSLHWALGELEADGPNGTALARAMWAALPPEQRRPYRIRWTDHTLPRPDSDCPGSFGQWIGYALRYRDGTRPQMVTLELPHRFDFDRGDTLPPDHWDEVQTRWKNDPDGYLADGWPDVETMLLAAVRHFTPSR